MSVRKFIGRGRELRVLEAVHEEDGFRLFPIYGRRRIGKTALIKQFISGKDGLYYLCTGGGTERNLKYFSAEVSRYLDVPPMDAGSFRDVFSALVERGKGRAVVALDEFPYLVQKDEGLLEEFQYIVDEVLAGSNVMLILCGSSVGMMENYVLSGKSPLYGRRAGQLELGEIDSRDIPAFLPGFDLESALVVESMVGGIPRYLMEFGGRRRIMDSVKRSFFSSDGYLYREAHILLHDELRDPDAYMNVLESIASGKTRLSKIALSSYLEPKDMSKYLRVLERLGIVRKVQPVTDRRPVSKKSLYFISDNYFRFWFRFVVPSRSDIEFMRPESPLRHLKERLNEHVSRFFEDFVSRLVAERLGYPRVGRWWHGPEEIDVVGVDDEGGRFIACEVKWRDRMLGPDTVRDLERKAGLIAECRGHSRQLLLVSKSGFTKKALELMDEENILHWDLRDIERMLKGNK